MPHVTADRVRETTTTTGTGSYALAGASQNFRAFSGVCANGDTAHYAAVDISGSGWEVGLGTWSTGNTLARTTILASSNGGAAVNWSAGTRDIFITVPAAFIASRANAGANSDITSLSGLTTALSVAQGGTGSNTAAAARTNLGATTLGSNLFTATNPSAVTFPRFNADNTVSSLSAADFRSAIGAGTGSGSVTSVGLGLPALFSVSGSPVTGSGTLTATLQSQTANTIFAAPNGTAGAPTFRALVAADIPTLNQNTTGTAANVTGTVAVANGGTGATTGPNARSNLGAAASGAVGSSGLTMNTSHLLGRTTASSGAIEEISVGTGLSLSGGTLAATGGTVTGTLLNVRVFTSSGTYTRTSGATRAVVIAVGGGGGGRGGGTNGGSGGTTSFGSHVSAAGGGGATFPACAPLAGLGGSGGTGALIAIRGAPGGYPFYTGVGNAPGGGEGGGVGFGVAGVRGGGGGGGGTGAGGGQGEKAVDYITSGLGATETVTIGAGGSAGSSGGTAGGAGYIIVYEYS